VLAAAAFIQAVQMIASREVDPLEAAVVSVGHVAAGDAAAPNVIPGEVFLRGTARAFSEGVRAHVEARIGAIAEAVAAAHRLVAAPRYLRRLSPTVNDPGRAAVAFAAARATVGEAARDSHPPITAGEDFSEMLAARPGAYAWLGTGAPRHPEGVHHNPHFDFNDEALTTGAAWWCSVALEELAP
jgi:metal-dependent amidase/aminoacylase/carboxypeptidase family protein